MPNEISEIGLILLLFIIGLEINLRELIRMGKAMLTLGIVQFVACLLIGLACFRMMGYSNGSGKFDLLYMAVALALSSTMIVVKLLHDKYEISTVAGQLTVGVLVLQDIWAIVFMAFQPSLLNPSFRIIGRSLGMGFILIFLSFSASRYLLPRIFASAGKRPELVLLTAIAWCFSVCGFAGYAGLSKEMGALIAGLSIATFPYGTDVTAKIGGVRDFFVTLFFVALGLKMPVVTLNLLNISLLAIGVVILSRLVSVAPTVLLLGRGLRNGLVASINLSQISEFSLVIVALGVSYGHVSKDVQMVVLISMLMASVMSTYFIMFNDLLARGMVRVLGTIGVRDSEQKQAAGTKEKKERDIVLLGCFREARELLDRISAEAPQLRKRVLVIDYNPELQDELKERGYEWMYGDLAYPETLQNLHIEHASLVICSVSDLFLKGITNLRLLKHLRQIVPDAHLVMTGNDNVSAEQLVNEGAGHVMIPGKLAADYLYQVIQEYRDELV